MTWTKLQTDYLEKAYPKEDLKEISKALKKSISSIRMKASRLKIIRKAPVNIGNSNGQWKGDNVGYSSLHEWVTKHKPKTALCENCKKNKSYDLANISGKYKRDLNDFEWLCRKCHMVKDNRIKNLRRGNGK